MIDTDPDTSWLGEYDGRPKGEFAIDRDHEEDCPRFWANAETAEDTPECNCNPHDARELGYFNPGSVEPFQAGATWIPQTEPDKRAYWLKTMRENARKDYARMEALQRGEFCFIGVRADAELNIPSDKLAFVAQEITSGGLWGIESDSDASYLKEIEDEELSELRGQLRALGFSTRAISAAVRNATHENV